MQDSLRGRSRHGELSLDQLVELQPGLGRLMPEVSRRYWILFYAAERGHWELAGYQWRALQNLFAIGAMVRPKMAKHLQAFQAGAMLQLEKAIKDHDWPSFETAFRQGIELANRMHRITDHREIRWQLPPEPPLDLDLTPYVDPPEGKVDP
jgi:hypothetical protein